MQALAYLGPQRLWPLRALPQRHVLALHDRRLDIGQQHRWHPGGIRAVPPCRHEPASDPAGRRRRGPGDAQRHPANRVRVRRSERQSAAGLHRRHRRLGADWVGGVAHGAVLFTVRDHHDRSRRQPASTCARTSPPEATSPILACTAPKSICTWSGSGRTT